MEERVTVVRAGNGGRGKEAVEEAVSSPVW